MNWRRMTLGSFVLVLISLALFGFVDFAFGADGTVKYLKNNIHVQAHKAQDEYRASYANWTDPGKGHLIIPVNTAVTIGTLRNGFTIITQDTRKTILFELHEGRMQMGRDQYIALITSPEPVRIDNLSEINRKGIKDGKAYVGMTKDGVRIALGYPATHGTPSLSENTWVYWTNRFRNISVEFDAKTGTVTSIK